MKKMLKKISLILVIFVCCLILCGCSEEKKGSNAVEDVTGTTTNPQWCALTFEQ